MKAFKIAALTACVSLLSFSAFAQSSSSASKEEKNVEDTYLSTVEDVVITELAASDERDNKMVALQYLEDAVNGGRTTPDMIKALDSLAGEGINTQARKNNRLVNNYPDIRAKACDLLGQVKTEESKQSLVKIALADNEPMVITAAIRALGDVGINDNDDVSETIAWAQRKNSVLNPTSSLALEVLIAYEKLADTVENKSSMIQTVSAIAANYHYVTPVRTRALELLKKLQGSNSNKSKSNSK
ncbi:MAG: HEAT repeat domain-containing protein [Treponema sp.]|nr:HEAT repeat domain-containing protein [Treponema sp.]